MSPTLGVAPPPPCGILGLPRDLRRLTVPLPTM